ncbi:hypothetical protein FRC08_012412 [Ceratobasidium sp. 394]|nr:hypothetical protein FRC08_012412 [Ceratobasidium sp. 394]
MPLVYGGEIARAASNVSSYFNRDTFLTFQFYASAKPLSAPYPESGIIFLDKMHDTIQVDTQAAYPNYADPTLSASQWQAQYYGSNYERLSSIKSAVDPQNVFRFPQSVGSNGGTGSPGANPATPSPSASSAPSASGGLRNLGRPSVQAVLLVVFSILVYNF